MTLTGGVCLSMSQHLFDIESVLSISPQFRLDTCTSITGSGTIRFIGGTHTLWPTILSLSVSLSVGLQSTITFSTQGTFNTLVMENSSSVISFVGSSGSVFVSSVSFPSGSTLLFSVPATTSMVLNIAATSINIGGVNVQVSVLASTGSISTKLIAFKPGSLVGSFNFITSSLPASGSLVLQSDGVYYVEAGANLICPPGKFKPISVGACQDCAPGTAVSTSGTVNASGCPSCSAGYVQPVSGQANCIGCSVGLFAANPTLPCQPAPTGFYQALPLQTSPGLVCGNASDYVCGLGAVTPIPMAQIPNRNGVVIASATTVSPPSTFATSSTGILFLALAFGIVGAITAALLFVICISRRTSAWDRTKHGFSRIDLLYTRQHSNRETGVMIERKSVTGGLFTIIAPLVFAAIAIFLFAQWAYQPEIKSSVLPFGVASAPTVTTGRFRISAIFWGFNGPCANPVVAVQGITGGSLSVSATQTAYGCNVTYDSGPDAVLAVQASVNLGLNGGFAALLSWEMIVSPNFLASINASSTNYLAQTIFPDSYSCVFWGASPTVVSTTETWTQYSDETYFASPSSSVGWLLAYIVTAKGSQASASSFNSTFTSNQVGMNFLLSRGTTFLLVQKQYAQSLAVLVGVVLGYFSSVIALFAVLVRLFEVMSKKCAKRSEPRTLEKFNSVFDVVDEDGVAMSATSNTSSLNAQSSLMDDPAQGLEKRGPRFTQQFDKNTISIPDN